MTAATQPITETVMQWSVKLIPPDEEGVAFYLEHYRPFRLKALELDPSAFGSTWARESAFTEDAWRARVLNPAARPFVAVQEGSNTVLSSVTLIGPSAVPLEIPGVLPDSAECWAVNGVWTLPGARRRGIGRETAQAAMRYAAGQAAAKGKDCLLTTVVYADNTGAGVYYEKLGFVAYREGLDGGRPTCELALLIPREGERVAF